MLSLLFVVVVVVVCCRHCRLLLNKIFVKYEPKYFSSILCENLEQNVIIKYVYMLNKDLKNDVVI
jgi:hypothetical protein